MCRCRKWTAWKLRDDTRGEVSRGSTRTPILALTAHASQAQREQCLEHGMDSVITKPVNLPGLLREITAVVGCPV